MLYYYSGFDVLLVSCFLCLHVLLLAASTRLQLNPLEVASTKSACKTLPVDVSLKVTVVLMDYMTASSGDPLD